MNSVKRNLSLSLNRMFEKLFTNIIISFLVISILPMNKFEFAVHATSINYGMSQQPITDISQLMPTLCQNQSIICEGSYCIPGVKRCECDLRQPVQFGRFCLRQVEIETKCFATSQCNHTIRDAVCIDTSSNVALDADSSKFKLEQWQQLNDLRQASKSAVSNGDAKPKAITTNFHHKPIFLLDSIPDDLNFEARDDVIISSLRNSPYEINYYTPELLKQNHTRRKTNSSDKALDRSVLNVPDSVDEALSDGSRTFTVDDSLESQKSSSKNLIQSIIPSETTTKSTTRSNFGTKTTIATTTTTTDAVTLPSSPPKTTTSSSSSIDNLKLSSTTMRPTVTPSTVANEFSRKKLTTKPANWPPGVCSCPPGYMFDSMLRKCLALSLADSHCQSDNDCKQIRLTHCSSELKKCECDEPLVWNQTELACQRPKPVPKSDIQFASTNQTKEGFLENLISPMVLAKLMPDQTMLLLLFVILVIISTLIVLRLIVRCFSSSNSALISPKNSKNRKNNSSNLLPPRSPYATLRKPEHKPNTQLSSFTQATRGRILNYDFEQENPIPDDSRSPQSPQPQSGPILHNDDQHHGTLGKSGGSLPKHKGNKYKSNSPLDVTSQTNHVRQAPEGTAEECLDLNDNVSISGQLDSESKSESNSVLAIPGPPPTQAPPYMLASAMKGQGSAIAAAAAAVANRRMQMAQRRGINETSSSKASNGTPVFL